MGRAFIFLLWLKFWGCATCIYWYEFIQVSAHLVVWCWCITGSVPWRPGFVLFFAAWWCRKGTAARSWVRGWDWGLLVQKFGPPSLWGRLQHWGFQRSLREGQKQGGNWTLRTMLMFNFTEVPAAALAFTYPFSTAFQKPPGPLVSRYGDLGI